MKMVHLNVKSGYSFFHSTLSVEKIVEYAVKNNLSTIGLTDEVGLFGAMEFTSLCTKNNIKPIYGMEVFIKDNANTSYPLILICQNYQGYHNLCLLTEKISSALEDQTIELDNLADYSDGLIAILPVVRSIFASLENMQKQDLVNEYQKYFSSFFVGLEVYAKEDEKIVKEARAIANSMNIGTTIVNNISYLNSENYEAYKTLRCIEDGITIDQFNEAITRTSYFKSDDEMKLFFTDKEILSTQQIAESCSVNIHEKKGELVQYPTPKGTNQKQYLQALCFKGLVKRLENKVTDEYLNRLEYELTVIDKMGYNNYFLVVWDYVKFAKKSNIMVGPGRGSAAGSLVSYVLGITNVDPIKHGLLFERFLNPERVSLPDIDIDFIDSRRGEVIEYIIDKYGSNRAAHVIAFQTFGAKQSLRDVGKVLGLSLGEIDAICKKIPPFLSTEKLMTIFEQVMSFKAQINGREIYRKVFSVATSIEGLPRQTTQHASGIVITNEPLCEIIPVYHSSLTSLSTQYDLSYLESVGLYKMDILGLKNLAVIDECVNDIERVKNIKIDINTINFDDPNIYFGMSHGELAGLFQLDTPTAKRATNIIRPSNFDDLVALLALNRPGPSEFIPLYSKRKNGEEQIDYIDPSIKDLLTPTYGIIIYQEQIMQILVSMAGFSLGQADLVRRAISKKEESQLQAIKIDFINGSIKKGYSNQIAEKVFELILRFANYGFNKSHTVSYAMVTAQMAYLKYYYPTIFYTSILNSTIGSSGGNDVRFGVYLNEMRNKKIRLLQPCINHSSNVFIVEGNDIRYSLNNIKGLNNQIVGQIIEERANGLYKDFTDFVVRCVPRGLNINNVLALIDAGAFDTLHSNRTTLRNYADIIIQYAKIISVNNNGQVSFDRSFSDAPLIIEAQNNDLLNLEREYDVLGLFLSGFPLQYERDKFNQLGYVTTFDADQLDGSNVKMVAYVASVHLTKTKKGERMAQLTAFDETGQLNLTVFPDVFTGCEGLLYKGNYLYIEGYMKTKDSISLIAKKITKYEIKGVE